MILRLELMHAPPSRVSKYLPLGSGAFLCAFWRLTPPLLDTARAKRLEAHCTRHTLGPWLDCDRRTFARHIHADDRSVLNVEVKIQSHRYGGHHVEDQRRGVGRQKHRDRIDVAVAPKSVAPGECLYVCGPCLEFGHCARVCRSDLKRRDDVVFGRGVQIDRHLVCRRVDEICLRHNLLRSRSNAMWEVPDEQAVPKHHHPLPKGSGFCDAST
mmetsp:Transcript_22455/g.36267  ORF Transcript_22455/g.36267 Transcript_22455/m.36267 type:complete len:213 (+) Transcript_22455:1142-1780(+)